MATLVSAFLLFFAGPSDPAQAMCPETKCNPARLEAITKSIGLDKPLIEQFLTYFKGPFVGRAFVYALAAQGEAGIARLLAIMEKDIRTNMVLTGVKSLREVGPHLLAR